MAVVKGLEWTFDTNASAYAKLRPEYPEALYQAIFQAAPICASSNVLEIGIGGGQATLPVLKTGCRLTAVEYGTQFSALCQEKFRDYQGFSVITGKFEEVPLSVGAWDLIYSASAFHWIPEAVGYQKVFSMLRPGGVFARFANHPYAYKDQPELMEAIQKLYAVYMPGSTPPEEYSKEEAAHRADIAGKYGFTDLQYRMFHRTRVLSAEEYIALLGTYSDHIALEEGRRTTFFSQVRQAIDQYGGKVVIYDTVDLQLARKP